MNSLPELVLVVHTETARAPEGLESYKLAEKPHQHPSEEDEEKLKVGKAAVAEAAEEIPATVVCHPLHKRAARLCLLHVACTSRCDASCTCV